MTLTTAIERLEMELNHAFEVARANKESGSSGGSIAYDEGRITGLKDALEVIYEIDPRT